MFELILVDSICGEIRNLGDDAILAANLRVLSDNKCKAIVLAGEPPKIDFLGNYSRYTIQRLVTTPSSGKIKSRVRLVWVSLKLLVAAYVWKRLGFIILVNQEERNFLSLFKDCKALLVVGGGYFRDGSFWIYEGAAGAYSKGLSIILAKIFKKPVFVGAQTLGPFSIWYRKLFCQIALHKVDLMCVREAFSLEEAKKLKLPFTPALTIDDAFSVEQTNSAKAKELLLKEGVDLDKIKAQKTIVAFSSFHSEKIKEKARQLLEHILNMKGFYVLVIPTMYGARGRVLKEVLGLAKEVGERDNIKFLSGIYDWKHVRSFFGFADVVVAVSLHSAVFALSSEVPALGLYGDEYYRLKLLGLFTRLGLEEYAFDVRKVNIKKIIAIFEQLLENRLKLKRLLESQKKQLQPIHCFAARLTCKQENHAPGC